MTREAGSESSEYPRQAEEDERAKHEGCQTEGLVKESLGVLRSSALDQHHCGDYPNQVRSNRKRDHTEDHDPEVCSVAQAFGQRFAG